MTVATNITTLATTNATSTVRDTCTTPASMQSACEDLPRHEARRHRRPRQHVGVKLLQRELRSLALLVLFTHLEDHLPPDEIRERLRRRRRVALRLRHGELTLEMNVV